MTKRGKKNPKTAVIQWKTNKNNTRIKPKNIKKNKEV